LDALDNSNIKQNAHKFEPKSMVFIEEKERIDLFEDLLGMFGQ
jgi:hypothetical protein